MIISPEKHVWLRLVTTPQVARVAGFQVYAVAVPKTAVMPFCVYRRANITRDSTLAGPIFLPLVNLQIATWGVVTSRSQTCFSGEMIIGR